MSYACVQVLFQAASCEVAYMAQGLRRKYFMMVIIIVNNDMQVTCTVHTHVHYTYTRDSKCRHFTVISTCMMTDTIDGIALGMGG